MRTRPSSRTLPLTLVACLLAWVAPRAASNPLVLVDQGQARFTIVVPLHPGEVDRRAAEILQSTVRKMSGIELPIVETTQPGREHQVVIGFAAAALPSRVASKTRALREDGFAVVAAGTNIYVASGGHKGTIYGVVHLLERYLGCRKFSPTAESVPHRDTVAVPATLADTDNPVNTLRIVNGDFARDADWRDWLRLDSTDEVFGRGYYVHTFNRLVPWETYFADHPEYFGWMNGKRITDQICPSRPEVLEIAVGRLQAEMGAQPDRHIWSVSQNDNFSYCQCDLCRRVIDDEGSPAGPIIRLVNAVAARFPNQTISTLAYQYSRRAPRVTKPAPNVQVMLCTIELNRSLPIAEDPGSRSFLRDISDWGRLTPNIYLWDYTVNFNHHVSPFPNLRVLQPNLQFFVRSGARQHFQQTNAGPGHEFSELKAFLLARLLWNPDVNVAAEMAGFLERYYGAAAPFIGQYIAALERAQREAHTRLDIYEPPSAHADDWLSAGRVAEYTALLDRAAEAAGGDPVRLDRVKVARLPVQYAALEIGKEDMFGPRGFYVQHDVRFEPRPDMMRLLENFHDALLGGGVRSLNEKGLTPQAYYDAARRFLDVQVDGNLAFRRPVVAEPPPSLKYGRGNVAILTNGVRGAHDFRVHWLGWEGPDFDLTVDLGAPTTGGEASVGTLWDANSWILHPRRVTCLVSADGTRFDAVGIQDVAGDQRQEPLTRTFTFALPASPSRFVRFHVEGTTRLPGWHASAGATSWVFVDEIVVRGPNQRAAR